AVLRLAFLVVRRIAGFGGRIFRRAGGLRCRGGVVLTSPAENTCDDDQRDDGADSGEDLVPCEPRLLRFFRGRGRQVSLLGRLAILVWLAVRVRLLRIVRSRVSGGLCYRVLLDWVVRFPAERFPVKASTPTAGIYRSGRLS